MHHHKPNYNFFGNGSATAAGTTANTHHMTCTNCTNHGHTSKHCPQPIISYGVILFRIRPTTMAAITNQAEALLAGSITGTNTTNTVIEFLMIQRRDSIGFVELMRGKYKLTDIDYITQQIAGMTATERERLLVTPFDELWANLWGPTQEGGQSYRHEKEIARGKLEALRTGTGAPSLRELIAAAIPPWPTAEWGFPKGRRDANESEYACAMRELWEETNINEKSIIVVRNLEPLQETFTGSNGVRYCHKYYVAYAPAGIGEEGYAAAAAANEHIRREVGNLQWMPAEVAQALIRPENPEKRKILLRVTELIRTYCPFQYPVTTERQRR